MAEPGQPLAPGAGAPLVPGPPQGLLENSPHPGLAYLYSRKNLLGIAVAIIVSIALVATGIGGLLWPFAALAAYAACATLVPARSNHPQLRHIESKDLQQAMSEQMRLMSGRVSNDIYARVAGINAAIRDLVPRAARLPAGSEDLYILQRIPLDYLPEALDAYLSLPPTYARLHPVQGGKTPKQLLLDQLDLLQDKMTEISDDIASNDTDRLLANGRFLAEKFGRSELQVPAIPPPDQ